MGESYSRIGTKISDNLKQTFLVGKYMYYDKLVKTVYIYIYIYLYIYLFIKHLSIIIAAIIILFKHLSSDDFAYVSYVRVQSMTHVSYRTVSG